MGFIRVYSDQSSCAPDDCNSSIHSNQDERDKLQERIERQQGEIDWLNELIEENLTQNNGSSTPKDDQRENAVAQFANFLKESLAQCSSTTGNTEVTPAEVDPFKQAIAKSLANETREDDSGLADKVPDVVDRTLLTWFRQVHTGSEIREVLNECLRLSNCTALEPVTINEKVQKLMTKSDTMKDQKLKWITTGLLKSAQPVTTAWAQLLKLEFHVRCHDYPEFDLQMDKEVNFDPPDAMIPLDKDNEMNLSKIICHVKLGLKALGFVHVQAVQKHRLDLNII